MPENTFYYSDYLGLKELLHCQYPESEKRGNMVHDEMLFIVVHQAYELWFKQILFELDSVIQLLYTEKGINDSNEIQTVSARLKRCIEIWKLLINQFTVMETMSPGDFFDFRKYLVPASGFQSIQFKEIIAKTGLRPDKMHYKHTNTGGLSEPDRKKLDALEQEGANQTLLKLTNRWLERMPFLQNDKIPVYWPGLATEGNELHPFLHIYRNAYSESVASGKNAEEVMKSFDDRFINKGTDSFSHEAMTSALFIMLYRHHPIFHTPFDILNSLVELDELVSNWLYRHFTMVRRMIGMREGTGGSSGAGYLEQSLKMTQVFRDLAALPTYMMEKSMLPPLPAELVHHLNFNYHVKAGDIG
jgi:tryptophan 2,3-dioxygenase